MTIEDLPEKLRIPGIVITKPGEPMHYHLKEEKARALAQALKPLLEREDTA